MELAKRQVCVDALRMTRNVKDAATMLGVGRDGLRNIMKRWQIKEEEWRTGMAPPPPESQLKFPEVPIKKTNRWQTRFGLTWLETREAAPSAAPSRPGRKPLGSQWETTNHPEPVRC